LGNQLDAGCRLRQVGVLAGQVFIGYPATAGA